MTTNSLGDKHGALIERLERASSMVADLCNGRRKWTMSVPVQNDDPDIVIGLALNAAIDALRSAASSTRRSDKCESCGYVESHDPNCPNPKLALPKTVREAIDKVTERVMDASLVESDLIELAETAMREARVSATGENRLLDEAGRFFDWGNAASVAMKNLLDAYERRIRSLCTPEQLEKKPWECAEFIEAKRILDAKPNWFVTSDDTGVKP